MLTAVAKVVCMATFESELRAALMYRRSELLGIANEALYAAEMPEVEYAPAAEPRRLDAMRYDVIDAEALTAVCLTRVGVSWDALAARYDISRQALHRRLSSR